ncbi:pentatricopeptide repeat-containing protein [Tanacetum coccineum]
MLPVCARLGEDDVGEWIHSFVIVSGFYDKYVSVRNSVVDFYCKRGRLDGAFLVFEDMSAKNVVSWNALKRLVHRGKDLFALMVSKHHLELKLEHYVSMVDLLGHGGLFPMVVEIIRKEEEVLNIEKFKESDEKNTSTMAAGFTSRTKHALIVSCNKEEYGDYTWIWPKLKKTGTKLQEPKDVEKNVYVVILMLSEKFSRVSRKSSRNAYRHDSNGKS